MSKLIHCASGATYQVTNGGRKIRRLIHRNPIDPDAEVPRVALRGDGRWLSLQAPAEPVLGMRMILLLEPLGDGEVTTRMTSVVVGIEGESEDWESDLAEVSVDEAPFTLEDTDPFSGLVEVPNA